jgi:hypothetical protein
VRHMHQLGYARLGGACDTDLVVRVTYTQARVTHHPMLYLVDDAARNLHALGYAIPTLH